MEYFVKMLGTALGRTLRGFYYATGFYLAYLLYL